MVYYLQQVKAKIIKDLVAMKNSRGFTPGLYIGKTEEFSESAVRHSDEGLPVLLRIVTGTPDEIKDLEDALIEWAKNERDFSCLNTNKGSGGNPLADKLYICLDSSVDGDALYEMDEVLLLGREYPLDLKEWR